MPNLEFIKKHRTWEDWLAMALGAAIWATTKAIPAASYWIYWNTTITGLVVIVLATLIHDDHARKREFVEAGWGVWLVISPVVFGYAGSGNLRYWHFGLGALVTLLAALELYQDWNED